jgi:hypothetical protein
MKYFKDLKGEVFAYDFDDLDYQSGGAAEKYIEKKTEMTEAEVFEYVENLKIASIDLVEQTKAELLQIDLTSIRGIREYIASKQDAPQILKDKETAAIEKRKALTNG